VNFMSSSPDVVNLIVARKCVAGIMHDIEEGNRKFA
jgi:hypothetical protein